METTTGSTSSRKFLTRLAIATAILAVIAAGCSKDDKASTKPPAKTTTTTTEKKTTTSTTTPTASGDATASAWDRDAQEWRGQNGSKFTIDCPPKGTPSGVWGLETYTDDSSICTAAVQVGLITVADGGKVEIEIAPGLDNYETAIANGVTSSVYAAWPGSFTFPAAPPGSGQFTVGPESWSRTAADRQGQNGTRLTVKCSANGPIGSIWGTATYTNDSSICTAAVHAGLLTVAKGGAVTIEIAAGQDSYKGSEANGVTSSDYGVFGGSFTFPSDQPAA